MIAWRRIARSIAVAIALAATIDPTIATMRRDAPRLGVIVAETPSLSLPSASVAGRTRRDESHDVRVRIAAALAPAVQVEFAAAAGQAGVIVIGDGLPAHLALPDVPVVATVTVGAPVSPNVTAVAIGAPARLPRGGRSSVTAVVHGHGVAGQVSTITLASGALVLGRRTHTWSEGVSRAEATFDLVPWAVGPMPLRVSVAHEAEERTTIDNDVDAIAQVEEQRVRILVLDVHPSWTSRFVARALERDPEIDLAVRTGLGRGVVVSAGEPHQPIAPAPEAVEAYDIVIVSSPDAESEQVIAWLDAFMRRRGGTVLILADDLAGLEAARRWHALRVTARTADSPTPIALRGWADLAWNAQEFAVPAERPLGTTTLASTNEAPRRPVLVRHPVGDGHVVTCLALDAWRFRGDESDAFARAWRTLAVSIGRAVPRRISIDVPPAPGPSSPQVGVRVRLRPTGAPFEPPPRLALTAGAQTTDIPLWPSPRADTFEADVAVPAGTASARLRATTPDAEADASILVDAGSRAAPPVTLPLAWLAAAHDAVAATPADLDAQFPGIRSRLGSTTTRSTVAIRPMRSPWWMLPFALALGADWMLRRRAGRR